MTQFEENEKLVKHIKKNTKDAIGQMSAGFESFDSITRVIWFWYQSHVGHYCCKDRCNLKTI